MNQQFICKKCGIATIPIPVAPYFVQDMLVKKLEKEIDKIKNDFLDDDDDDYGCKAAFIDGLRQAILIIRTNEKDK